MARTCSSMKRRFRGQEVGVAHRVLRRLEGPGYIRSTRRRRGPCTREARENRPRAARSRALPAPPHGRGGDDHHPVAGDMPVIAIMGFRFVEGIDADLGEATLGGESLGVAPRPLPRTRRESSSAPFRHRRARSPSRPSLARKYPGGADRHDQRGAGPPPSSAAEGRDRQWWLGPASSWNSKSSRNMCRDAPRVPITRGCTQVSKETLAPSQPVGRERAGSPARGRARRSRRRGMPRRLPSGVPSGWPRSSRGRAPRWCARPRGNRRCERLDAEVLRHRADVAGEFAVVAAETRDLETPSRRGRCGRRPSRASRRRRRRRACR